ncbi:mitochondrial glycine transporter-like [Adelges cooleyi]|uniref:mitochondrial glycine transporter-like n=1 Tax=Adelges cooleyi TaxID=133065 RepID=UPI00217FC1B2|nr:mitochondrial glycine transporter-like [Adelges cooleyi]
MSSIDQNGSAIYVFNIFQQYPIVKSLIASSTSGLFSTIMFQPLDVVKTVLQNPKNNNKLRINDATKLIWQQDSLYGFWRGLTASLARNIPGVGIHITLTQLLHSQLVNNYQPSMINSGIAGFSSRCIVASILMPFTVLKTRLESGQYRYNSLADGLLNIYKLEGWKVLCRGWTATVLRDAPFSALYFMSYVKLKDIAKVEESVHSHSFYIFGCGLLSGLFASLITHPFDVIKTSQQLSKDKLLFFDTIILINQKYGAIGYFKGLSLRLTRRTLMTALSWTVYETLLIQLKHM